MKNDISFRDAVKLGFGFGLGLVIIWGIFLMIALMIIGLASL